jgi:hypothetical protein
MLTAIPAMVAALALIILGFVTSQPRAGNVSSRV